MISRGLDLAATVVGSPGRRLDSGSLQSMQRAFGHDFSRVRVHADAHAAESAVAVDALAYTVGHHVVFGPNEYNPGHDAFDRLLAHELTHVLQQEDSDDEARPVGSLRSSASSAPLEEEQANNAERFSPRAQPGGGPKHPVALMRKPPPPPSRQRLAPGPAPELPHLTRREVRRDDYLRDLAARPGEGLRAWKGLRRGEPLIVVQYMALFYGMAFATRFREEAGRGRRPDDLVIVTNRPDWTPDRLRAAGYVLRQTWKPDKAPMYFWIHPSGREVWLLPSEPTTAAPAVKEAPPVADARRTADDFEASRQRLANDASRLRDQVRSPDYPQQYQKFISEYDEWQKALNTAREDDLAEYQKDLAPEDAAAFDAQKKRIDDLFEWKITVLGELLQQLPAPPATPTSPD